MPHYYTLGKIPHKRHTQFRKPDGGLYSEQLFSTEGFSDDYSLLYHCHPPTQIIKTEPHKDVSPQIAEEKMLKHRCFEGFYVKPAKDFLDSRVPVLVNNLSCFAVEKQGLCDNHYSPAQAHGCLKNLLPVLHRSLHSSGVSAFSLPQFVGLHLYAGLFLLFVLVDGTGTATNNHH